MNKILQMLYSYIDIHSSDYFVLSSQYKSYKKVYFYKESMVHYRNEIYRIQVGIEYIKDQNTGQEDKEH